MVGNVILYSIRLSYRRWICEIHNSQLWISNQGSTFVNISNFIFHFQPSQTINSRLAKNDVRCLQSAIKWNS